MKNRKLPTYRYVKVQQTNQWRSILATIDALPSFMESVGEMLTVGFAELLRQVDESLAPLFRALHEAFRPFVAPPLPEGVIPTRQPHFVIWDSPTPRRPMTSEQAEWLRQRFESESVRIPAPSERIFSREVCEQADRATAGLDDSLPAPVYRDAVPLPPSYWEAPVMVDSAGPGMLIEELLDESTLAFIKKRDGKR